MASLWLRDIAILWMEGSVVGSLLVKQPDKKSSVTGSSNARSGPNLEKTGSTVRVHLELTSSKIEDEES